MTEIALREVADDDLDLLFRHMSDPEAVRMAAFTAREPSDRAAFDKHMAKVRANPECLLRAVTLDGEFVGTVSTYVIEGETEVTYWIDRAVWGQGIASRALRMLLELQPVRPLHARAASDNAGSLRVLAKAGFRVVGTDAGYANARGGEIEESVLLLDA
jgi:RimJ/RimL family protein N-acetyltransferase